MPDPTRKDTAADKPSQAKPPQTREETIRQSEQARGGVPIDSAPGQGPGANLDPALGGPKGGAGQFVGNPPGPLGSDNPDLPRRDQLGDATPGTVQPNPANPVPLPPRQVAEDRAARDQVEQDRLAAERNAPRDQNAPKPDRDTRRDKR